MKDKSMSWSISNLIVPVGGVGSRFSSAGYLTEKPLIKVEKMTQLEISLEGILKSINFESITIGCRSKLVNKIEKLIENNDYLSSKNIRVLSIGRSSRGASETVYKTIKILNLSDQSFWTIDSDTFLAFPNFLIPEADYPTAVAVGKSTTNSYSYVDLDHNMNFSKIVEKKVISAFAVCGLYGFRSATEFNTAFKKITSHKSNSELYLSKVVTELLRHGKGRGILASEWIPIGTPQEIIDLTDFQRNTIRAIRS